MSEEKPIERTDITITSNFIGIEINTDSFKLKDILTQQYAGILNRDYTYKWLVSHYVNVYYSEAVKKLIELCDNEGNFLLDGEKGLIKKIIYGLTENGENFPKKSISYNVYIQNNRPEKVIVRSIEEIFPVRDEIGEGRK